MQLRMFAEMLREGSWVEASIDTAIPSKNPPKPDLRKMVIPLGPIIVFGASNFPFAYSTAGGDTASALAAGCSVVVKAHPAHAGTSEMVKEAIEKAIHKSSMPPCVFQHVHGASTETGKLLVQHDLSSGVGFTGSFTGGKALYDYAHQRNTPIPVFSEMGSTNPVVFLPDALKTRAEQLASAFASSVTLGMGQFCTKPGLMFALENNSLDKFLKLLSVEVSKVSPGKMLHAGIHKGYSERKEKSILQKGVKVVANSTDAKAELEALPAIATVSGTVFLENPFLHEEVFGPYSLMVSCKDENELRQAWMSVAGQLTTSLVGTDTDFSNHPELLDLAPSIAGRIVFNGVPTGVEVCPSIFHGGPFPATTDSRFTSVGTHSVKRWVRPVCYQNCPEHLLPEELKNNNPLNIWRLLNNQWTNEKVKG